MENLINRKKYKEIKAFDRNTMEKFLEDIYGAGYENGMNKAMETLAEKRVHTYQEMREKLLKIKGIGERKVDDILEIIMKEELYESND